MKCPICEIDLVMTDRQGVEIDYCPKCRGVWLDRGELDKIIEKSSVYFEQNSLQQQGDRSHEEDHVSYGKPGMPYRKHKGGIIGELFDF